MASSSPGAGGAAGEWGSAAVSPTSEILDEILDISSSGISDIASGLQGPWKMT